MAELKVVEVKRKNKLFEGVANTLVAGESYFLMEEKDWKYSILIVTGEGKSGNLVIKGGDCIQVKPVDETLVLEANKVYGLSIDSMLFKNIHANRDRVVFDVPSGLAGATLYIVRLP